MGKIIDAHVHCSDGRSDDGLRPYAKLNGLRYDLEELLELMEASGVARALLLSPPMRGGMPLPNAGVVRLCERSRDALFPVFTVEPEKGAVRNALELAQAQRGFVKGFKIWLGYRRVFATDKVFAPLYDYAEEHGLPVMFHTGDTASSTGSLAHAHPLTLDEVANERESLKIVICHVGNPWIADTAELLYKHANVFADVSGLMVGGSDYHEDYLRALAQRVSDAVYYVGHAEKFLFGTDYPIETPVDGLSLVSMLKVDAGGQGEDTLAQRLEVVFDMMRPEIEISEAPKGERGRLLPILDESFEGIYLWHARRTLHSIEVVRAARTADGEDVGLAMLKVLPEGAGYVYYIAVPPRFRRQGIGGKLLDDALAQFAARGVHDVYASVGEENVESNTLFESRGFAKLEGSEMAKRYGRIKAFVMYREMMVVRGEMLLAKRLEGAKPS